MSFIPTGAGNLTSTTVSNSYVVTLTAAIPAGSEIYVAFGTLSFAGSAGFQITDSAASGVNTYVQEDFLGLNFATQFIGLFTSKTAHDLAIGDTITIIVDPADATNKANGIAVIILTTDGVISPYVPDPGESSGRTFDNFNNDTGPVYPIMPSEIVNQAARANLQSKLIMGLVAWTRSQVGTETYTPDYVHLATLSVGAAIEQITISVSYTLVPSPVTTQPTYFLSTLTGGTPPPPSSPAKAYGFISCFWTISHSYKRLDSKRNHRKGRRYIPAINSNGQAIIYNDDNITTTNVSALAPTMVDSDTSCDYPAIWILPDDSLIYTYVKISNIYYKRSFNIGKTWSNVAVLIASGFTAHDLGMDFAKTFFILPAFKQSDSHIYIITGVSDGAGSITWNNPVDTGITAKEVSPAVTIMPDGSFELTYVDTSNNIDIKRCNKISITGIGSWV